MSIFARSTCAPSGNSPAFMRRSRSRFSSTDAIAIRAGRARLVTVPRFSRISSSLCESTYALPFFTSSSAISYSLLEVVARVQLFVPLEAEPLDVVLDGLDVLDVFGERVRVVEAQVAPPRELLGDAEVQADGLRVTDVQEAVRLGRKARVIGRPKRPVATSAAPSRGGSPCAGPPRGSRDPWASNEWDRSHRKANGGRRAVQRSWTSSLRPPRRRPGSWWSR